MTTPIPLDLVKRVWQDCYTGPGPEVATDLQAALATHLPELAACHYREVDREVIHEALRSFVVGDHDDALAGHIAAALSDATNGGHWEEGNEAYRRAARGGLPRRVEYRGPAITAATTLYGWVPADPDAALLAIVDADTLRALGVTKEAER